MKMLIIPFHKIALSILWRAADIKSPWIPMTDHLTLGLSLAAIDNLAFNDWNRSKVTDMDTAERSWIGYILISKYFMRVDDKNLGI